MADKLPLVVDPVLKQLREMQAGETIPAEVLTNALAVVLTGLSTSNAAGITAADSILDALGKLQGQLNGAGTAIAGKVDKIAGHSLISDAERVKLTNVATGATANATDAQLRNRSTHTGLTPATSLMGLLSEGAWCQIDVTAAGTAYRYADGRMTIISKATIAAGTAIPSSEETSGHYKAFYYPALFVDAPCVSISVADYAATASPWLEAIEVRKYANFNAAAVLGTGAHVFCRTGASELSGDLIISMIAEGRWKA